MLTTLQSPPLLFKNVEIRIYITVLLPIVLYVFETWSVTLWEELRWRCMGGSNILRAGRS
jgi:hypothetical protein